MTGRLICLALCLFLVGGSAVAGAGSATTQAKCVELTRGIGGESTCPGSAGDWHGDPAARSPECIQFGQTYDGTAVLVNPCVECRTAAVERIDLAGNLSFRSYPVAPKSTVDLPTDGLARARIVRDDPCG
jgi:hypothetical protein